MIWLGKGGQTAPIQGDLWRRSTSTSPWGYAQEPRQGQGKNRTCKTVSPNDDFLDTFAKHNYIQLSSIITYDHNPMPGIPIVRAWSNLVCTGLGSNLNLLAFSLLTLLSHGVLRPRWRWEGSEGWRLRFCAVLCGIGKRAANWPLAIFGASKVGLKQTKGSREAWETCVLTSRSWSKQNQTLVLMHPLAQ